MVDSKEADRIIHLVNPRSPGLRLKFGRKTVGVPVGLGVVGSEMDRTTKQAGFNKEVDIRVVDEDLGESVNPKPGDLIGISTFSLTAKRTQKIIEEAVARGAYVIAGGIHATEAPDDFTEVGAISFLGEAGNSKVFDELMRKWLHTGKIEQGVRVESEGRARPENISLAGLPVSEEVYKQVDGKSHSHMIVGTVGCTKGCATCSVMGGRVVRERPRDEIIGEMERREEKMGYSFTDSDITAGGDNYLYPLLESMVDLKIPRGMSGQVTIEALDLGGDRLFEALAKAKFHRLFVGIESNDENNLRSIGKRHNLKYDAGLVKEIVKNAHKQGIKITGLFIVGFLPETVETIRGVEDYIKETELDDVNISVLTPLPGTGIWRQFATMGRFDPEVVDTDQLDFHHLIFDHPMGNELLLQEYQRLCNRVFAIPEVWRRSWRAFSMSRKHNLPESFERQFRNSVAASFLQRYVHGVTFLR